MWWQNTPALELEDYSIDCSGRDMSRPQPDIRERMSETFDRTGLVLLRNTELTRLSEMSKWANHIVDFGDYQGGANSRASQEINVYDTGAPASAHLHYHHEMAYMGKSIRNLAFCCDKATEGKGAMFVSDNMAATDAILATDLGQKLKEKGICYVRCLTDAKIWEGKEQGGIYNHWQTSFGVDTVEEVERLATEKGLVFDWGEDNFLKTRCYISAFEYFSKLDRNVLYSSVADDAVWFDAWPGVMDLPTFDVLQQADGYHRPLKLLYGDDTPFTQEELQTYVDVYDRNAMPINWQVGDVLVVCNYRWAHGRPAYFLEGTEERNLGVVLGKTYHRVGQLEGKW